MTAGSWLLWSVAVGLLVGGTALILFGLTLMDVDRERPAGGSSGQPAA